MALKTNLVFTPKSSETILAKKRAARKKAFPPVSYSKQFNLILPFLKSRAPFKDYKGKKLPNLSSTKISGLNSKKLSQKLILKFIHGHIGPRTHRADPK